MILLFQEAINANSFFGERSEISFGNVDGGFQESDTIIEGEFGSGYQEHFYLEPWSCLVVPRIENDEMDIFVGTQNLMAAQVTLYGAIVTISLCRFKIVFDPNLHNNAFLWRLISSL